MRRLIHQRRQVRRCRAYLTVSRPATPSILESSHLEERTRFAIFAPFVFPVATLRVQCVLRTKCVPIDELMGVSNRQGAMRPSTVYPLPSLGTLPYIATSTRKGLPLSGTASVVNRRYAES